MLSTILKYISGPVIGAIIGYFTNHIAVKMLFFPRKEVRVFGHRLPFTPGVIPKGKPRLAHAIGKAVGETLITKEDIETRIYSTSVIENVTNSLIDNFSVSIKESVTTITKLPEGMYEECKKKISTLIGKEIIKSLSALDYSHIIEEKGVPLIKASITNPMIAMFLNDDLIKSLSAPIGSKIQCMISEEGLEFIQPLVTQKLDELDSKSLLQLFENINFSEFVLKGIITSIINELIRKGLSKVFDNIKIEEIVEAKINNMDIVELEDLIMQVMKKELNAIVNLGALIGFILGLLNLIF